ncbi:hypothetical protein EJ08DRAFT_123092 [Tothia fuscella]|uniref:Ubiquitin-protein ligase n=1 Tax=Tothia fuscella TaxID=1048955 RepID=A0A9P4NVQ4_9PEZI|nr:hypothetical protein EJ08DRAFT_123092 [Tothia fuscella]
MRNLTFFAPSKDDLVLFLPRVSERAKAFAYYYGLDDLYSRIRAGGSTIAEPTMSQALNASKSNATKSFVQASAAATPATATPAIAAIQIFSIKNFRAVAGIFTYLTSKWAIVTLVMTVLLNRTQFYASSRVPLNPRWPVRLGLYLIPIVALLYQTLFLLEGLRCQTSPQWAHHRYENPERKFTLDYAGEGGFLHKASSSLLFWESEESSCANVKMTSTDSGGTSGSLSLLWPLFLSFCLSQFIETLGCALEGSRPVGDINLVELSLAFAEAESMVLKPFEVAMASTLDDPTKEAAPINKKMLLQTMNVAPEMLLISLLWALNNLSSNILAVFKIRHKYRLINTGVWGLAYLAAFSWSIFRLWSAEGANDSWVFRFPTVFIIGFCPHILVLAGMAVCGTIYAAALILTALSLPPGHESANMSIKERFHAAYQNLQANVHFSNTTPLTIRMSDDFYTTLLSAGFILLTAASEAVYLNEGAKVRVSNLTWLERKRIQELQQGILFKKTRATIPSELRAAANDRNEVAAGNAPPSGYALERKARNQEKDEAFAAVRGEGGVGFIQRGGRWQMALRLLQGTSWLFLGLYVKSVLFMLDKMGISWRPQWVRNLIGETNRKVSSTVHGTRKRPSPTGADFWVLSDDGKLSLATNANVDVEEETRKRHRVASQNGQVDERNLDENLYTWWKEGGWWGDVDNSGDYQGRPQEDDTTSIISYSTDASSLADGNEWNEIEESGRRTPMQADFTASTRSREATPDDVLDADSLATLLDPQSFEEQQEARMLSRRLRRPQVMTRAQYRRQTQQERAAVVTSSRYAPSLNLDPTGAPLTEEAEEKLLERFILESRASKASSRTPVAGSGLGNWETGAEGLGSSGPQCVVCQDSPRTILLWPCGCLCLCDDCRVNMAARNFGNCVCCRTGTVAYSRLYVP